MQENSFNGSLLFTRIEQSKKRTEPQTKQKAELQNLRMQINRLRQKGEDTEELVRALRDEEKSYECGKTTSLAPEDVATQSSQFSHEGRIS